MFSLISRLPVNALTHPIHELAHRIRLHLSPEYVALVWEAEQDYRAELWANDTAAQMRRMGDTVPVGTIICGVKVTR